MEKENKKISPKKWVLIAAAVVLLIAAGFGLRSLINRNAVPAASEAESSATPASEAESSAATAGEDESSAAPAGEAESSAAPASEAESSAAPAGEDESSAAPAGIITVDKAKAPGAQMRGTTDPDVVRFNYFLTSIVQQDIVNTKTDLDEDAELVRFAFRYRKTNKPASVTEETVDGVTSRTLTLDQVNETLSKLFGKTLSPDREDYSIALENGEVFSCVYRDGSFVNTSPFPTERYSFPIRFALTETINTENCVLHYRLYRINPWIWGEGEAERHVGVMPASSFIEVDDWEVITFIGEGNAKLKDLSKDLQLVEMEGFLIQ